MIHLFLVSALAQEASWVDLPPLNGVPLPDKSYLILGTRVSGPQADFIRKLRRIPAHTPGNVPSGLLIDKHLHRRSQAIDTEFAYFESDWLDPAQLGILAAATRQAALQSDDFFDRPADHKIRTIYFREVSDYHAMVDAWAKTEVPKRLARKSSSVFVDGVRCDHESRFLGALSLALADAFTGTASTAFRRQTALHEGFHVYLTGWIALEYTKYVSYQVTTPSSRGDSSFRELFETARTVLSHPKQERLETILRSELNTLTVERLSVSVALIHYLLERKRDGWGAFCRTLDLESLEKGKLRSPDGLFAALKSAVRDGFGLSLEELELELQSFVRKAYLFPEEQVAALGISPTLNEGFLKVCELKRLKQPVSARGEKLYAYVLRDLDKALVERAERF